MNFHVVVVAAVDLYCSVAGGPAAAVDDCNTVVYCQHHDGHSVKKKTEWAKKNKITKKISFKLYYWQTAVD